MTEKKDTNPKDSIGSKKLAWHLVPWRAFVGVVLAFAEGALKYGAFNWRVAGVRATVYTDGADRHIKRFLEGEDWDPEVAGYDKGVRIHHLDKAIASLMILRDSILHGNWVDDRAPAAEEWITEANRLSALLVDSVPNPVEPFTQMRVLAGEFRPAVAAPEAVIPEPEFPAPTVTSPVPHFVYWYEGNFYHRATRKGMGHEFYLAWADRAADFATEPWAAVEYPRDAIDAG